jgi:transposase-like protein
MASLQITLDETKIQDLLRGDEPMRRLLEALLNELLQAELTDHLHAAPGERTEARRGYRNGSYRRALTTRLGTLELDVPRDRDGTFSTELFERYQRSEKALVLALMDMVVQGVSTRKVKKVTRTLCGRAFSKSTVSELSKGLDEQVRAWAERSLEETRYPFILVDALYVKVRRQGAVRSTAVLIAVGITETGQREILGLEVSFSETRAAWAAFFQGLRRRGLQGVEFAVSDAHEGLVDALERSFPGAVWQRCQAHFLRNVLDATPETLRDQMHAHLRQILYAGSPEQARAAFEQVQTELGDQAPKAVRKLEEGYEAATAVLVLPEKYRRRLRTTNMLERLIEEVRRRERVIRIFPNLESVWRLVGALLCEQHEAWSTGRLYLKMDAFDEWKAHLDEPKPAALAA